MDMTPENRAFALRLAYYALGGLFLAGGSYLRMHEGMDDIVTMLIAAGTGLFGYASKGPGYSDDTKKGTIHE